MCNIQPIDGLQPFIWTYKSKNHKNRKFWFVLAPRCCHFPYALGLVKLWPFYDKLPLWLFRLMSHRILLIELFKISNIMCIFFFIFMLYCSIYIGVWNIFRCLILHWLGWFCVKFGVREKACWKRLQVSFYSSLDSAILGEFC